MKVSVDDCNVILEGNEIRIVNDEGLIVLKAYKLDGGLFYSLAEDLIKPLGK